MTWLRVLIVSAITAEFWLWLHIVLNQTLPALTFFMHVLFIGAAVYLLRSDLREAKWWLRAAVGIFLGYVASICALIAVTVVFYGADQFFERIRNIENLLLSSLFSAGWLYGALVVVALCLRRKVEMTIFIGLLLVAVLSAAGVLGFAGLV
jgi:hypothetical protein